VARDFYKNVLGLKVKLELGGFKVLLDYDINTVLQTIILYHFAVATEDISEK
jgi:hypothetical protein